MDDGHEGLNYFRKPDKGMKLSTQIYRRLTINNRMRSTERPAVLIFLHNYYSEQHSITEGSLSTHHSTICRRLESDRNTTRSTQWKTAGYRGWMAHQRQMVL